MLRVLTIAGVVAFAGVNTAASDNTGADLPIDASHLNKENVFTLYRSSRVLPDARLHVATFDAAAGREYNLGNCLIARDLFARQPGVKVLYWCEEGRFEK
ncbi:MAG: hypothetical protein RIB84_12655 [Sneathiellaceae bacterium]